MLDAHAPDSQLVLVDGDNFEPKNAERQHFTEMGNKAKSVARSMLPFITQTDLIPMGKWVVDSVDGAAEDSGDLIAASELLEDGDIVFICVDNMKARKDLLDAAAKIDNITVFNGGNEDDGFGSTYLYLRENGVDITDHPAVHHPEFENPPDKKTLCE